MLASKLALLYLNALDLYAIVPYFQLYTTFQCLTMCMTV
jgi:hypothetical protein